MMWIFLAAACLLSQPASVARLESSKPRSLAPGALFLGVGCCVFFGRPTVVVAVGCIVACALWFANDLAAARRERRGAEALAALGGLDRVALHSQLAAAVHVVLGMERTAQGRRLAHLGVLEGNPVTPQLVWTAEDGPLPGFAQLCSRLGVEP